MSTRSGGQERAGYTRRSSCKCFVTAIETHILGGTAPSSITNLLKFLLSVSYSVYKIVSNGRSMGIGSNISFTV